MKYIKIVSTATYLSFVVPPWPFYKGNNSENNQKLQQAFRLPNKIVWYFRLQTTSLTSNYDITFFYLPANIFIFAFHFYIRKKEDVN